jgi:hypothetical protein
MKKQHLGMVVALAGAAMLTQHTRAQCNGFNLSSSTGATLVPGVTDVGNHGDDTATNMVLPFPVTLYGTSYSSAAVSSNGNMQFTAANAAYTNSCLPGAGMGVMLAPYWDDLRTDAPGSGIFTSVSGTAPNRILNVEWRSTYFSGGGALNFQIRLYEDGSQVQFIYASAANAGASATIGIQHPTSPSTQYSCETASVTSGLRLTFTCNSGLSGVGSANPSSVYQCRATSTRLTVQTYPGVNPPSTGLGVVADLSNIGGSGSQLFYDNGTNGDVTANDNIFSFQHTVPSGLPGGGRNVPFTVSDAQGRSSNGSFVLTVNTGSCPTAGPDVYVGDLSDMSAYGTVDVDPGAGVVNVSAYSIGTNACNQGDIPVLWIDHNSTPGYTSNQHPVIAQNLYRLMNGRLEQIGQSWLKHGFVSTNSQFCSNSCVPPPMGGDQLGVNCSDLYGSGLNGSQGSLGPRSQVNATTGYYPHPYTAPAAPATIGRRLQVYTNDVTPALNPGAQYIAEGQYVTADDAQYTNNTDPGRNALNNFSYRLVNAASLSTGGSPTFAGNTVRFKGGIHAWKDLDPSVQLSNADYVDRTMSPAGITGRFVIASKVTNNGNGTWHYEYAIYNQNADRAGGSFTVPVDPAASITNIGFHGVFAHSGEPYPNTALNPSNWTGVRSGGSVGWSCAPYNPATLGDDANALRWGTMYNFRFDADRPPQAASGAVGLFKPATASNPATSASAAISAPVTPCGTSDFNGDGDFGTDADIEAFFACLAGNCCATCFPGGADFNGDGDVGTDADIEAFFRVLAGGNC